MQVGGADLALKCVEFVAQAWSRSMCGRTGLWRTGFILTWIFMVLVWNNCFEAQRQNFYLGPYAQKDLMPLKASGYINPIGSSAVQNILNAWFHESGESSFGKCDLTCQNICKKPKKEPVKVFEKSYKDRVVLASRNGGVQLAKSKFHLKWGSGQTVALVDTQLPQIPIFSNKDYLQRCGTREQSSQKIISRTDLRPNFDNCGECVAGLSHSERVILFGFASSCAKFPGGVASGATVAHIAVKSTLYVGNENQNLFVQCDIEYFMLQINAALEWILDNHITLGITSISLSLLDGLPTRIYNIPILSPMHQYLEKISKNQLWISAPTGNGVKSCRPGVDSIYCNSTGHREKYVSFPASVEGIVAVGCSKLHPSAEYFYIRMNFSPALAAKTLFAPTSPTSACNTFVVGASMVVREAVNKKKQKYKKILKPLQEVTFEILYQTGSMTCEMTSETQKGSCIYRTVNLTAALMCVHNGFTCL